jgi:hypothetical protein
LQTFHKILTGCELGDGAAWEAFIGEYTALIVQLARLYLPDQCDPLSLWHEVLVEFCTEDFKLLRTLEHQSEREFLADLRVLFLEKGLAMLNPSETAQVSIGPCKDGVSSLLKGLPLLHQEIVLLKLAGYSDKTLERMFRITPGVAHQGLEILNLHHSACLGRDEDKCPWPGAWLTFLRDARDSKSDACPAVRLFVRIQDGQVGWYDKEPAETHLLQCLHCLEAWTALREISYWRTAAPPINLRSIEALRSAVPARNETRKPSPLLKRVFGQRRRGARNGK